jgi:hypothetical protein
MSLGPGFLGRWGEGFFYREDREDMKKGFFTGKTGEIGKRIG